MIGEMIEKLVQAANEEMQENGSAMNTLKRTSKSYCGAKLHSSEDVTVVAE